MSGAVYFGVGWVEDAENQSGVVAGTYGNASNVGTFTVDAGGEIISAANVPIAPIMVTPVGPLTVSGSPVSPGGTITLTNIALDSMPTNSWKAGSLSSITGANGVAVGHLANTTAADAVAAGYQSQAGSQSVAYGSGATINVINGVGVGANAITTSNESTLLGASTLVQSLGGITVGYAANVLTSAAKAIAIGHTAIARNPSEIIIGDGAASLVSITDDGITIGRASTTVGGICIGAQAYCGNEGLAIGRAADNRYGQSVALGDDSEVRTGCVAIGDGAKATNDYANVIGGGIVNNTANTTIIGSGLQSAVNNILHELVSTGFIRSRRAVWAEMVTPLTHSTTTPTILDESIVEQTSDDISVTGGNKIVVPSYSDTNYQVWRITILYSGMLDSGAEHPAIPVWLYSAILELWYENDQDGATMVEQFRDFLLTSWLQPISYVAFHRRFNYATGERFYLKYYYGGTQDQRPYCTTKWYIERCV